MIRVIVADDSPTVRELLVAVLESDPSIRVVGQARNGREAVDLAVELRPDLITMDVNMPVIDGLEATKEIMVQAPTPILIVSSAASQAQVELSLSALRAGALMVLPTPPGPGSPEFAGGSAHLLSMVRVMSEVKVVRRWPSHSAPSPSRAIRPDGKRTGRSQLRLVTVAASTGGPAALQRFLTGLPRNFPLPILVVQHIATDFIEGLAHWLTGSCDLHVKVAEHGERLDARTVYLAPDQRHLGVTKDGRIALSGASPIGGFRPSATHLFASAARAYGASVAAVILTGMGSDGVEGLKAVRAAGGFVLAQDEATSVVYGMPRVAVEAGVVDSVLPLPEIATRLLIELSPSNAHEEQSYTGR